MVRVLSFIIFLSIMLLTLFLGTRYVWRRLVRDTALSGRPKAVASAIIIGATLLLPVVMTTGRFAPRGPVQFLNVPIYTWLGALLYLVLILGAIDLGKAVKNRGKALYQRLRAKSDEAIQEPVDEERRLFLARAGAGVALLGTGAAVLVGRANVSGDVSTPIIEVPMARLPKALDGFRIVQFTDVHIGPILDQAFLRDLVEKANAMRPDLVVITGDLVDSSPGIIGHEVAELARLKSRFGTYFVTGNHEYYSGVDTWLPFLSGLGIRTLTNERVSIGEPGASFDLAGLPDTDAGRFLTAHTPNLEATLKGRREDRELVLLAHRPEPIHVAAKHRVGLQISGHTHGGQLWPVTLITQLVHPYSAGLHQHSPDTKIYVSRGAGFWGPPMRIGAPAELPLIVLTSA